MRTNGSKKRNISLITGQSENNFTPLLGGTEFSEVSDKIKSSSDIFALGKGSTPRFLLISILVLILNFKLLKSMIKL